MDPMPLRGVPGHERVYFSSYTSTVLQFYNIFQISIGLYFDIFLVPILKGTVVRKGKFTGTLPISIK